MADGQVRPEIVYDYNPYHSAFTDGGADTLAATGGTAPESQWAYSSILISWIPPRHLERKWTAIVLHHSGTDMGSTALFDKSHRQGNGWDGVGYDFVIGNGRGSNDGDVEVTFRWRRQKTGAHCKTGASNWANREAVGICLVGNFNKTAPTKRQMQSLVKVVHFLQRRYNIPTSRIYGHKSTPGARVTECPGKNFPMARLKRMLAYPELAHKTAKSF